MGLSVPDRTSAHNLTFKLASTLQHGETCFLSVHQSLPAVASRERIARECSSAAQPTPPTPDCLVRDSRRRFEGIRNLRRNEMQLINFVM